jgi:uncharacterized membrane protein YadS
MVRWLHSRDTREVPFLIVLLIEILSLASVAAAPQHWLRAVGGMTVGIAVAGLFRLLLSNDQAGMLRVRSRPFDVACYWSFAVVTIIFAISLPQG